MKEKILCFPVLLLVFLMVSLVTGGVFAQGGVRERGVEVAQQRTLFDLLFGPREAPAPNRVRRTPAPHVDIPRAAVSAPSVTQIPDEVEKAEGATRLAVFGDSLAIDMARAFQRLYAEDENLVVIGRGVGSSGFVRDDFYDWNRALAEEIAKDSFDIAVVIIGINDRQQIGQAPPLSDEWKVLYRQRVDNFLLQLRSAGKPVIWVGLPPMRSVTFSSQIGEISSIHRLAALTAGVEFVDIYDRFAGEDGKYSLRGPNLNGEDVVLRKSDGIHFSAAGSDKLVFYVNQSMRKFYRGESGIAIAVADPLEGTDGFSMVRPPFQGNGRFRLLQVAGPVVQLTDEPVRANELVLRSARETGPDSMDPELLLSAPAGRADAFGVGVILEEVEPDTAKSEAMSISQ